MCIAEDKGERGKSVGSKRIAICDDNREAAFELKAYIEEWKKRFGVWWSVEIFYSGEELLKYAGGLSAVFLDIEMSGLDGIETGKILHQENPECRIIMATGREERYKEAFYIRAFRFLTKPYDREEIFEALTAVSELQCGERELELFAKRNKVKIKQKEICYIKACNGDTEFLVGNQIFRKEISLNELEEILDERIFFRAHRQYIINFGWIERYDNGRVDIKGQSILIARRKRKEFERQYIEFDIKYRR